jgi:hypothetical protein
MPILGVKFFFTVQTGGKHLSFFFYFFFLLEFSENLPNKLKEK